MTLDFKHGINGYQRHGCRCETCRAAKRDYARVERARVAAKRPTPPPTAVTPDPDLEWLEDPARACRQPGVDPRWFFPDVGQVAARAKNVCARCPFTRECLEYAMVNMEPEGVWGGLTHMERRRLRRNVRDGRAPVVVEFASRVITYPTRSGAGGAA